LKTLILVRGANAPPKRLISLTSLQGEEIYRPAATDRFVILTTVPQVL
jgi:hypothetical protein